jgi:isopenicillin N synthase-like dioxygenase
MPPGPGNLRKKAHADSGTLTLLASQDYLPGSGWRAGDGGLQLLSASGQWLEVEVPPGTGNCVQLLFGSFLTHKNMLPALMIS